MTPPPAPASISKAKPGDAHKILDDFRKVVGIPCSSFAGVSLIFPKVNKGASFSLDHSTLVRVFEIYACNAVVDRPFCIQAAVVDALRHADGIDDRKMLVWARIVCAVFYADEDRSSNT